MLFYELNESKIICQVMSHVRVNLGLLRSRPSGSHASSPARDSERVRSTRLQQSVALITLA